MQPLSAKVLISSNTSENVKKKKQKKNLSYIIKQSVSIYSICFFLYLFYVEIVRDKKKTHVQPTILPSLPF